MGLGGVGDFYVIRYFWAAIKPVGEDLDTQTQMVSPVTSDRIGWATPNPISSFQATLPVGDGYVMTWGGDELITGAESVLIDINKWNEGYGNQNILEFELRGNWFESVASPTPVVISVRKYLGGQMILDDALWINPTAVFINTNYPTYSKVVTQFGTIFPPALGQLIVKLRLNLASDTVSYF